jgi:large subunit ribosomal protein L29
MEIKDLRSLSPSELSSRVQQWKEELFRAKFKGQSGETRDTSIFRKLRKDIARAKTVLVEKKTQNTSPEA